MAKKEYTEPERPKEGKDNRADDPINKMLFGVDPAAYQVTNPQELAFNVGKFLEQGAAAFQIMMQRAPAQTQSSNMSQGMSPNVSQDGAWSQASEMQEAMRSVGDMAGRLMQDPQKLSAAQQELAQQFNQLWTNIAQTMTGQTSEPLIEPEAGDKRFADPDYDSNAFFNFSKQAYLIFTKWSEERLADVRNLDEHERAIAKFHLAQITSALSPTNFIFTNPEVMRTTLKSNGENLVQGMENLVHDLDNSDDLLKISQTDTEQFEVGKNIAVTPGKIIYQNELFQLIQYKPQTKQVHERPLLIVPPWINKFYIMDLVPEKSYVRFAVEQGFTVFLISWVNPDETMATKSFWDYMTDGILQAAKIVTKATGVKKPNVLGYCVGGTLLGTTLAYLAAKKKEVFNSATFLTTQVDFSHAGDLLVFIDDAQLLSLEGMMAERGYLDGSRMANVFNMLRPKDLIWPYIINNYMLGKKPFPFDLLYWNQDSTRMCPANHAFYLREFYKDNKLADGKMKYDDVTLDLAKVKIPIYDLAAKDDHIAPAESVLIGANLFGGPVEYVLAGSGHVAGVINPPSRNKYQYWTNEDKATGVESWLESAIEHPGSWWPHWAKWLAGQSGEMVPARKPGGGKLKPIEKAPGSYVKVRG